MTLQRYAAFLRGINVGGNNIIRMADVRAGLEAAGCTDVATVLASGNVVFTSPDADVTSARERVERALEAATGRRGAALVRTIEDVRRLVARDPFGAVEVTPDTRLYVTFLSEPPVSRLRLPYRTPRGVTLLELTDTELFSVLVPAEGARSTDSMSLIEKDFGSGVTTRSWNTVLKIAAPDRR